MAKERLEKAKCGICLSGGGALGYAHIGVLQALLENDIYPEIISGSSMGSIIGVLYANGVLPEQMLKVVRDEKMYKISSLLNPSFHRLGFSSHKLLRKLLKELVPHNNFEELQKEFHVCVSNINKASWEIISSGNQLHDFVIASASIPFVFESLEINKHTYVDGGLFNNLPAQVLKDKCEKVIGVDVLPHYFKRVIKNTNEMMALTIRGVEHQNSVPGREMCDYIIDSPAIKKYHEFNFDKYEQIYKIGYESAIKYIEDVPDILELKQAIL